MAVQKRQELRKHLVGHALAHERVLVAIAGEDQPVVRIVGHAFQQPIVTNDVGVGENLVGFAGNEHNLPVIGIYKDVNRLYGDTRIAYTPTLLVSYGGPFGLLHFIANESPWFETKVRRFTPPHVLERTLLRSRWVHPIEHVYDRHASQAHEIVEAGGRVGVGGHGELQGLGYHWELWALASGGFSNAEALRAATRHGAEMIGVATDVGSITESKLADLVVLEHNPLENIRHTTSILWVIKNGSIYDPNTLEELWPTRQALEEAYWMDHQPPITVH